MWVNKMMGRRAVPLAAIGVLAVAACGSASTSTGTTAPVVAGVVLPLTGAIAAYGAYFESGIQAATHEINADGGIMGRKLQLQIRDSEGDPVDAASAVRSLLPYNPDVFLGSSGLDQLGIVTLFEEYKIPDFFSGGLTSLDRMTYKYVFRVNASDNLVAAAMVLEAIHLGCTNAAVLFSNDENGLAELTPLLSQYKSLGGTPTTVEFDPSSTTYLTEVSQAFANNPSCLILHANQNADGAIFSAMKQLGDMRVPILGDLPGATTEMRDALGISDAVKYLYGFTGATVSSPADTAFLNAYAAVYGPIKTGQVINNTAYSYYDGTIIAALAMVAAHSTDPTVWVNYVTKVSNPPGTPVYTYAEGVKLLNEGKKINYEGAWGSEDFNQFHNVFSPYEVTRWNSDGSLLNSNTISQTALEQLASK